MAYSRLSTAMRKLKTVQAPAQLAREQRTLLMCVQLCLSGQICLRQ